MNCNEQKRQQNKVKMKQKKEGVGYSYYVNTVDRQLYIDWMYIKKKDDYNNCKRKTSFVYV